MKYESDLGQVIIEKDGQERNCDVLFTFDCEELGKTYIGFTDHTISENGRKNIYVKSYNPIVGTKLEDVSTPEELEMIGEVLTQIDQDNKINK